MERKEEETQWMVDAKLRVVETAFDIRTENIKLNQRWRKQGALKVWTEYWTRAWRGWTPIETRLFT